MRVPNDGTRAQGVPLAEIVMSLATSTRTSPSTPAVPVAPSVRPRDPRLDVFRGLGMVIIMIAHVPWNLWASYVPGRYGFSDAAEMFVFMSGMASAIAFGRVFERSGWVLGTARIAHRVWQVYWVHVGVFVVIAALVAAMGPMPYGEETYVQQLNLTPFFEDTAQTLVGFLTLSYVPNYFDILPMYLVILALVPFVVLLARVTPALALGVAAALWLAAQAGLLDLPAEPWSDRTWFFNPFAWQLLFFLGFFWMRGDLPAPPRRSPVLLAAALAVVIATVPLAHWPTVQDVAALAAMREALEPFVSKTRFGILRLVHFLALAYVALWAVDRWGGLLTNAVARVLAKVGQQALATFAAGLVVSRLVGIYLDFAGRDPAAYAVANIAGIAVLVATAYGVAWIKAAPWRGRPAAGRDPAADAAPALKAAE